MIKKIYSFFLFVLLLVTSPFLIRYLLTNQKITIYKVLAKNNNVFITFADQGAVALAQRDYPDIKDKIFTFKSFNESNNINNSDSAMISMLPQPYDFDSFEPMSENYQGTHYSLNPKFEDANIGIGSVIRERRKNFVKTWKNIYFLQPLNKGALMHIYPNNWLSLIHI